MEGDEDEVKGRSGESSRRNDGDMKGEGVVVNSTYASGNYRSKAELRRTSQTPEIALKNPRVQALSVKWRQVWLMTMDRRRRLQDALDHLKEVGANGT